jgi:thiol-disulfide isomerase/thioredoxin
MNTASLKVRNWPRALRPLAVSAAIAGMVLLPAIGAGLKVGDSLPDLAKFNLEGTLPETKGKVVIVDFWASWCAPCKASFPVMDGLLKKYREKGLVIIAVNVDEDKSDMEKFLKKTPVTFSVVRDGQQKLVAAADVATMPTSFLIDREGKIRFTHVGFEGDKTRVEYEKQIEELLK